MPFGITSPPEEFQRRMDLTLGGLDGTKAIADNILVFGTGSTQEEAEKSHDERLTAVLERCRQKVVRLNNDKMQFKQQNYVQRFDPGLADATKPFRDLLKKESVFYVGSRPLQSFQCGEVNFDQSPCPQVPQSRKEVSSLMRRIKGRTRSISFARHPIAYAS